MFSSLVLLIMALTVLSVDAQNDGVLTFWGDRDFTGEKWEFHRTLDPQYCYNDNAGKPTSITWKNQIKAGTFNGKAKIAFYTKHDCQGKCLAWYTTESNFPRNLTLDRINDQIKSFMLWKTSIYPDIIVRDVK